MVGVVKVVGAVRVVEVIRVVEVVVVVSKNLAGWYEKLMITSWKRKKN